MGNALDWQASVMKIVHIMQSTAHGALSYSDLVSGGRGVTGSEQAMLYLAKTQADQKHQVTCYIPTDTPGFQNGVDVIDVRRTWPRLRRMDTADVVVSWLSSDLLRGLSDKQLRITNLQINDWMMNSNGYEEWVDVFVVCTASHKAHLWTEPLHPKDTANVEIIPNGVDNARFAGTPNRKIRKCVYLSSPDRGLHWLVAMWPEIRFAFPDAELHVFYEVQKWLDTAILLNNDVSLRARYVCDRGNVLGSHGLYLRGAMSPTQLAQELLTADVMLYPCDPVRYTEGFGVAVLDSCAAGVIPIISNADAFGEVYGVEGSGVYVVPKSNDRKWLDDFLELSLTVMGSSMEQKEDNRKTVQTFAHQYDWTKIGVMWDNLFERYKK